MPMATRRPLSSSIKTRWPFSSTFENRWPFSSDTPWSFISIEPIWIFNSSMETPCLYRPLDPLETPIKTSWPYRHFMIPQLAYRDYLSHQLIYRGFLTWFIETPRSSSSFMETSLPHRDFLILWRPLQLH